MTREEAIEYLHKLFMQADITDAYGDMDDTEPYETAIDMAVKALQEQKTGKWAQVAFSYRCSACQEDSDWPSEYCPWCGAKMEENQ